LGLPVGRPGFVIEENRGTVIPLPGDVMGATGNNDLSDSWHGERYPENREKATKKGKKGKCSLVVRRPTPKETDKLMTGACPT